MGLPLAAQFASHGWSVIAVDIDPAVVAAINEGRSHIGDEPGRRRARRRGPRGRPAAGDARRRRGGARGGRRRAHRAGHARRDVATRITARWMPRSRRSRPGLHAGSTVIFETTLPVGDTRDRYAPRLAEASGLTLEEDLFVAFSPERLYSGAALRNLATYPKLVGGLGDGLDRPGGGVLRQRPRRRRRRDVVGRGGRVREARRHDLPRREHRAGQRVRRATPTGSAWTSLEVIAAANSQPYSHIHQPGLGVGGHCIPVYPHFLLDRAPELELVALARAGQRRPGRVGPRRAGRDARRRSTDVRPRPRPDLPRRRQGAGLLARPAADRRASASAAPGRSPTTRC